MSVPRQLSQKKYDSDKPDTCTAITRPKASRRSSWPFFFNQADPNTDTTDTPKAVKMTKVSKDMGKEQVNSKEDSSPERETVKKIGAYKMILRQWPYFRKPLESGAAQKYFAPVTIRLKHMDANTLEIVARLMYIQLVPTQLMTFQEENEEEDDNNTWTATFSWEKALISAERFKLEELQRIACSEILHDLSEETAIPFLLRTAHLYYDFQALVVEYVAWTLRRVVTM